MKILVTGSDGFISKNLLIHLKYANKKVFEFNRNHSYEELEEMISHSDFIFHLAGINRPILDQSFSENITITEAIIKICTKLKKNIPILYTSSTQAILNNDYGTSKKKSEDILIKYHKETGSPILIYRLENIFGKWCKPNYNSVVATFCYNIANNLEVKVNNPETQLSLVHIDNVIMSFLNNYENCNGLKNIVIKPIYKIKLSELLQKLMSYKDMSKSLHLESVGKGFDRALYSTYLSYLPKSKFSYKLKENIDDRGKFVEVLKNQNVGQISFLTAPPGITRGCHFHHTKNEKFILVNGKAKIRYRNLISNDTHEILVDDSESTIVETIPGWVHDITNIGKEKMIVLLWTNEIFDPASPDTFAEEI
tara:strand:- start:11431 stop:12528 length:1098 start_codon:yes stop_codon:yes gene_type:complete